MAGTWAVVFAVLALSVACVQRQGPEAGPGTESVKDSQAGCALLAQPPPASDAFIEAHRDRDLQTASLVTSPLYKAEMERRGRAGDWPLEALWTEAAPLLSFTFVGAIGDDKGFTYALYTSIPLAKPLDGPTTLWRIDLDPSGKVIWGEPVRDFGRTSARPACLSAGDMVPDPAAPTSAEAPTSWWPRLALGMRSDRGDGYVAVLAPQAEGSRERSSEITFASIDEAGRLRPGYWSFGRPDLPGNDESVPLESRLFDPARLGSADLGVLETYLVRLWAPPLKPNRWIVRTLDEGGTAS